MKVPYAIAAGWIITSVSGGVSAQAPQARAQAVSDGQSEAQTASRYAAPRSCECRDWSAFDTQRQPGMPPAVGCLDDDASRTPAGRIVSAQMASNPDGSVTLDFTGDSLIRIAVDPASLQAALANGAAKAYGNTLVLTASAADFLRGSVLNSNGANAAGSLSETDGTIVLDAGCPTVAFSGKLPPLDFGAPPFIASRIVPGPNPIDQPLIVTPVLSAGASSAIGGGLAGMPPTSSAAPIPQATFGFGNVPASAGVPSVSTGTANGSTGGGSPGTASVATGSVSVPSGSGAITPTVSGSSAPPAGSSGGTVVASNPVPTPGITPPPSGITPPPPVVTPPPVVLPPVFTSRFRPNNGIGNGGGDGVPGRSHKSDANR